MEPIRHILLTGTGSGIGRACALALSRKGYRVWAGIQTDAEALVWENSPPGTLGAITPIYLDVTKPHSIIAAESTIRRAAAGRGLFGLVNNAGICVVGPVECVSLDDWQKQFHVNVFGVIAVTQVMLPLLRDHNAMQAGLGSRIINMGSITGEVSTPLFGAYSASKFALRAVNDALRTELRSAGIHVSLIVPGTIQSDIWRKEREGVDAMSNGSPARRLYGPLIDSVSQYVFACATNALPASCVADVVSACLRAEKPRMEYRVGWEAKVGSLAKRIFPARWFDFLLRRQLLGGQNGPDVAGVEERNFVPPATRQT